MLKPKARFNRVTEITPDFLIKNNITGVILDVDNTLIDLYEKPLVGVKEWCNNLKNNNLKVCIASNSLNIEKISNVAKMLDIPFVYWSWKPFSKGLKKAKKILGLDSKNIAEVGDQLFTDVLGANRMKMFSILTTPIGEEKHKLSKLKRKIEKIYLRNIHFTNE